MDRCLLALQIMKEEHINGMICTVRETGFEYMTIKGNVIWHSFEGR